MVKGLRLGAQEVLDVAPWLFVYCTAQAKRFCAVIMMAVIMMIARMAK
jgi:hypothetical protein